MTSNDASKFCIHFRFNIFNLYRHTPEKSGSGSENPTGGFDPGNCLFPLVVCHAFSRSSPTCRTKTMNTVSCKAMKAHLSLWWTSFFQPLSPSLWPFDPHWSYHMQDKASAQANLNERKKAPKCPKLLNQPRMTQSFVTKHKEETVDCPIAVKPHCFISSSESGSNLERCGTRLKPHMHAI